MTVYILGGGATSLALAQGKSDHGQDFVLIERDTDLGGLAKTVSWEKIGDHDLGPHKIFSMNEALNQRVNSLIDADQWVVRDKKASILWVDNTSYPPSPFALLHIYTPGRLHLRRCA